MVFPVEKMYANIVVPSFLVFYISSEISCTAVAASVAKVMERYTHSTATDTRRTRVVVEYLILARLIHEKRSRQCARKQFRF